MSETIEDILSQCNEEYNISYYRKLFAAQDEFDQNSGSLVMPDDLKFDEPSFNTSFVLFVFVGKHGHPIINELEWTSGIVDPIHIGRDLLNDIDHQVNLIGPTSNKQQIEWRLNTVIRKWLPLLKGFTEDEQMEFEDLVHLNFNHMARHHTEAIPDYEQTKVKLKCNGNEAVFLFLCLCEDFWLPNTTANSPIVSKLIAKLEETFQFKHEREKKFTDLGNFKGAVRKFRNGELRNINDLLLTFNNLFMEGKKKFTK
jgi:hypothetical protein